MQAFYDWFRVFYQDTGINLTFIYDSYDRNRLIDGFWMTVWLWYWTTSGICGC